jgi:hypothetical protein
MDPNETLFDANNAADYLREWLNLPLDNETPPNPMAVEELLNAFDSLNEWLKSGGCLPDAWKAQSANATHSRMEADDD